MRLEQKFLHRLARLQHRMNPTPVFLDSKEEIGWKAPLQNSNLWQEAL
jgi:hypothetical protein